MRPPRSHSHCCETGSKKYRNLMNESLPDSSAVRKSHSFAPKNCRQSFSKTALVWLGSSINSSSKSCVSRYAPCLSTSRHLRYNSRASAELVITTEVRRSFARSSMWSVRKCAAYIKACAHRKINFGSAFFAVFGSTVFRAPLRSPFFIAPQNISARNGNNLFSQLLEFLE